jgi:hypothetical protein
VGESNDEQQKKQQQQTVTTADALLQNANFILSTFS